MLTLNRDIIEFVFEIGASTPFLKTVAFMDSPSLSSKFKMASYFMVIAPPSKSKMAGVNAVGSTPFSVAGMAV